MKAESHSVVQDITLLLQNWKVHYHVQNFVWISHLSIRTVSQIHMRVNIHKAEMNIPKTPGWIYMIGHEEIWNV
jgi:hypothetical protein